MFKQRSRCLGEHLKTQWWLGVMATEVSSSRLEEPEFQNNRSSDVAGDLIGKPRPWKPGEESPCHWAGFPGEAFCRRWD